LRLAIHVTQFIKDRSLIVLEPGDEPPNNGGHKTSQFVVVGKPEIEICRPYTILYGAQLHTTHLLTPHSGLSIGFSLHRGHSRPEQIADEASQTIQSTWCDGIVASKTATEW